VTTVAVLLALAILILRPIWFIKVGMVLFLVSLWVAVVVAL